MMHERRGKIGITFDEERARRGGRTTSLSYSKYNISSELHYHLSVVLIVRHPILDWVVHRLPLLSVRGVISLGLLRVPRLG